MLAPPTNLACPACGGILRRLTVLHGVAIARCEYRFSGSPCGAHLLIVSAGGVASVSVVPREHFDTLETTLNPRDAIQELDHADL